MDYLLLIPRLIRPLISSSGLVWCFLVLAGIWLLWRKQNRKMGYACLLVALFFSLVGGRPLPGYLLSTLEKPYQSVRLGDLPKCDVILILGGGQTYSEQGLFNIELHSAGDRVIAAFEAIRQGKADTLVVSSGYRWQDGEKVAHSDYLTNWVTGWNLFDNAKMISLPPSRDTREEGQTFKKLAQANGWKKVMLITSAFHTRRSVATLEHQGFDVIPFPVDFYIAGIPQPKPYFSPVPAWRELRFFDTWFKEIFGHLFYQIRG